MESNGAACGGPRGPGRAVVERHFERREEAFGHSVVPAAADSGVLGAPDPSDVAAPAEVDAEPAPCLVLQGRRLPRAGHSWPSRRHGEKTDLDDGEVEPALDGREIGRRPSPPG